MGDPFRSYDGMSLPMAAAAGANVVRGQIACPLYSERTGEGECTDRQHPVYLGGCNVYPQHPAQVADKPSCTYSFVEVAGGG